MTNIISIAHNPVHAKLLNAPKEAMLEVHRLLSYRVEGSEHMSAFKSGGWDGRSSFFSYDKQTFPTGLVRLVAQGLKKMGHEVQIVCKPAPEPLGPLRPEVDEFGYSARYDYQPETIDALVRHKNITVQVATGGGKSRIARMAMKRIDRPTLFLTTRGILMHQMHRAIETMEGTSCAILGDGDWGIPYKRADGSEGRKISKFTVGMVQTLALRLEKKNIADEMKALKDRRGAAISRALDVERKKLQKLKTPVVELGGKLLKLADELEKKQGDCELERPKIVAKVARHEKLREATIEILSRFELVIVEEAHEVSGDSFYRVMEACKNAAYRMALTATPFMKDDEEANMRLLAACGPVAVKISEKMLIDRGILAKPYFKYIAVPEANMPKKLFRSTPWHQAYEYGIVENEMRNKMLCAEALRGKRYGLNAMMLVQHKAHGEILLRILTAAGARAVFIYGEDNQAARDKALRQLGAGEIDVLIGSTILDVGVDVPSVGMIILCGGGKAEVATRQRIGRGLREKKGGWPNVALIVDVADDLNNHLKAHYLQRRNIVEMTPGFGENIVRDFDFVELGITRLAA
jgi:superfamily II DNA or RNA helicase